ncbi:MAG: putative manganese-dependent inorganic diphosphatase [Tissierellia bacterium]|nr:putative manganese-dependent inorganic diphosphatase [Tissierellia bacterium]
MKDKIYITGHKNPDTDSICSALAYQSLKERLGYRAEAIRLGDINQETQYVLDYFQMKAPRLKTSIKPQVRDLTMDPAYCVNSYLSLNQAMEVMEQNNIGSLPVVDKKEKLIGIVSLSNIATCYMEVWDDTILGRSNTPLENIVEVLKAKVIYHPEKPRPLSGKMAIKAIQNVKLLEENDIVIVGDNEQDQHAVIKEKVALMILTGSTTLSDQLLQYAKDKKVTVLTTGLSTFMAARLLPQSVPISHVMTKDHLVTFHKDDLVDEVREVMSRTRFRSYPVLDDHSKVVGIIARYHLINEKKKKVILVDHNEKNQSIDDLDAGEIVEIIDHHRVANIATSTPVYFRNEPVGSTSTIISKMFFEAGIQPSRQIAGLLCAAIISDTLLFRSPTATDTDRFILDRMSKIANIDVESFALDMFKAGTSLAGRDVKSLLSADVKDFSIEEEKIRVCQIFTMDLDSIQKIEQKLQQEMETSRQKYQKDIFLLMVTDIFHEMSQVYISGRHGESIASEFNATLIDDKFIAKDLLSRKKQMIPAITTALVKDKNSF